MSLKNWIKDKLELYKDDFEFRFESLILNVTENISKSMVEKNINRTKLAELLDVSPPAVTKILNGNSNFTLKTLLSLSDALDLELNVEFKEKKAKASERSWVAGIPGYESSVAEITIESGKEIPFTNVSSGSYHPGKAFFWDEAA